MDDLISRQAAIEALEREKSLVERPITETRWFDFGLRKAQDVLSELPSAQPLDPCETCLHKGKGWDEVPCDGCTGTESKYEPNTGWIPVSERLPDEGQMCLVCDRGAIGIDTYIGYRNPYNWKWYVRDYDAWMPLPEPYKEA